MERKLRYLETEIQKEKDIPLVEPQEFCEAPKPKEMIDLEVCVDCGQLGEISGSFGC